MDVKDDLIRDMFGWLWSRRNPATPHAPNIPTNQMRTYLMDAIDARSSKRSTNVLGRALNHALWVMIAMLLVSITIGAIDPTPASWASLVFLTLIGGMGWIGNHMPAKSDNKGEGDDQ